MLASLAIFLLASSAIPSTQSNSLGAPGCGPENVKFDVKTESKQHPMPAPEAGKALIFFLQDDAKFESRPRPTTQFGIDGAWVGATQANSYFYVSVDPGEHHLCANWQSFVGACHTSHRSASFHRRGRKGLLLFSARHLQDGSPTRGGRIGGFGHR